jgi:hypothetical protein
MAQGVLPIKFMDLDCEEIVVCNAARFPYCILPDCGEGLSDRVCNATKDLYIELEDVEEDCERAESRTRTYGIGDHDRENCNRRLAIVRYQLHP